MSLKNLFPSLAVFLLLIFSVSSWANDTLLYRSNFEERLIKKALQTSTVDFAALFCAINADSLYYQTCLAKLNTFYNAINARVSDAKSGKQKAKLIFKEVHSYFFKQYEENVVFNRIFDEGIYNCVTASMLYSLVLKNYDIPFEIKEKPTHIYLVALPGSDNILFETTNPRGFYIPDEKMKREYVAGLVNLKFTTQEHVNSIGVAKAFNEFYYNTQNIELKQLAGLQYYNQALAFVQSENIHEAIKSALKMEMLYPCAKHQFLKMSLIGTAISNSTFDTERDILYLCEFANSSKEVSDKKMVVATFGGMINDKLMKEGNDTIVTRAFTIFKERMKDEEIVNEISYLYFLQMTYWQSMKGNMDISMEFAENAYKFNQKDARLQDMIVTAIISKTDKLKGNARSITILDEYLLQFSFLKTHTKFRSFMVYSYALRSYRLFSENSGIEAYKYFTLMEDGLQSLNGKIMAGEQVIGMAYAEAGAYHFRKKEYNKSREVILKGLEILPDHDELNERLKIVEDETMRPKEYKLPTK